MAPNRTTNPSSGCQLPSLRPHDDWYRRVCRTDQPAERVRYRLIERVPAAGAAHVLGRDAGLGIVGAADEPVPNDCFRIGYPDDSIRAEDMPVSWRIMFGFEWE